MSFYGNSYQYLAETFACIIMKNAGIDISDFPDFTTDLEHASDKTNDVRIEASEVEQGLLINSGNRWITLKPIYDKVNKNTPYGLEVWHEAPAQDGTLIAPVPEVPDSVSPETKESATLMDFDKCIKIPLVVYDQAGHSVVKSEATYFKMPVDPTGEIRKEVNDFKETFESGMEQMYADVAAAEERVNGVKDELNQKLVKLGEAIDKSDAASLAAGEAKSKADSAEKIAGNAMTAANGALSNVSIYGTSIANLQADVQQIKEKLGI